MPEKHTKQGALIKRSMYEEYSDPNGGGGLCTDPHDPAFLGTLCIAAMGLFFGALVVKGLSGTTVVYPPQTPVINNVSN